MQSEKAGRGFVFNGKWLRIKSPDCWCEDCDVKANEGLRSRMSLCPECGDKRCPRAKSHDAACPKGLQP